MPDDTEAKPEKKKLPIKVIGIIAAIALPNLLNALDRAKQKRTMADLRSVGSAIEQYAIDNTDYPVVSTINALEAALIPIYAETISTLDGWGNGYVIDSITDELRPIEASARLRTIVSSSRKYLFSSRNNSTYLS